MKHKSAQHFTEHSTNCLNCGNQLSGNFCSNCGQSAKTHRLSIAHFLIHDFVHSVWHVDHGIFFTIKEVLIVPGTAAAEYIAGKRAGRFPILTLLLVLLGIMFWMEGKLYEPEQSQQIIFKDIDSLPINEFIDHYKKWMILGILPIVSIISRRIFRRTGWNYTEHLLLNSYALSGGLLLLILVQSVQLIVPQTRDFLDQGIMLVFPLMFLLAYVQAFRVYPVIGVLWRSVIAYWLSIVFVVAIIVSIIILLVKFAPGAIPGLDTIIHQA